MPEARFALPVSTPSSRCRRMVPTPAARAPCAAAST